MWKVSYFIEPPTKWSGESLEFLQELKFKKNNSDTFHLYDSFPKFHFINL